MFTGHGFQPLQSYVNVQIAVTMLDLFEVFDAPAEVLQNALRQVRIALPDAHGPDKLR